MRPLHSSFSIPFHLNVVFCDSCSAKHSDAAIYSGEEVHSAEVSHPSETISSPKRTTNCKHGVSQKVIGSNGNNNDVTSKVIMGRVLALLSKQKLISLMNGPLSAGYLVRGCP